ncbi:uncharacterized protein MELLADRAFT_124240 [Melampsora larici-populina 98AG31]|uniref:Secreted protein n=1 Tax=Melampsora larici-populina (strain 98AG31 / pathotype 3-4-7) TaxID=747676 RepID=F4S4L2_MELLP|nr:uncharacterized protein MELLADRAFT_124240 [Melampsora larici-populina 98AG31]EGG00434.1 secreted protein [Melampsora larici-populina 98AG31]
MSRKLLVHIFHVFLVVLLVADLGSHIFAAADAIECTYGWTAPTPGKPWFCDVQVKGKPPISHACKWCRRNDKLLPSARDCVDRNGISMNGGQLWACDLALRVDPTPRKDHRQFLCDQAASVGPYFCLTRNENLQCPRDKCSK